MSFWGSMENFGHLGGNAKAGMRPLFNLSNPENQDIETSGNTLESGSVLIKFTYSGAAPTTNEVIFMCRESGLNDYVSAYAFSNGNLVYRYTVGGSHIARIDIPLADYLYDEGEHALEFVWNTDLFEIYLNGVRIAEYTSTFTTVTTEISYISIGQTPVSGTLPLGEAGTITKFQYYNAPMIRAQAEGLTYQNADWGSVTEISFPSGSELNVVAGQSNALMSGATASRNTIKTVNTLYQIQKDGDAVTADAAPVVLGGANYSAIQQAGRIDLAAVMGDILMSNGYGQQVSLNVARGNTQLSSSGNNGYWKAYIDGSQSNTTIMNPLTFAAIQVCLQARKSHNLNVKRFYWSQGENDAATSIATAKATYKSDLNDLFDVIERYVNPDEIYFAGLHDQPSSGYDNWTDIDDAISEVAADRSYTYIDKTGLDIVVGDEVHVEIDGAIVLCHRMASAVEGETIPLDIRLLPTLYFASYANSANFETTSDDIDVWNCLTDASDASMGEYDLVDNGSEKPEFDSALYSNSGGVSCTDSQDNLLSDTAFTASDEHSLFMACDIPASLSTNGTLFQFGSENFARWLLLSSDGSLRYRGDGASNINLSSGDMRNAAHVFGAIHNSTSDLDFYIDSDTATYTGAGDPDDSYSSQTSIQILGQGTGDTPVGLTARSFVHLGINVYPLLAGEIMSRLADDSGVTLS